MEIKTIRGTSVHIASRKELLNVGNTNGRDIKCKKCREPYENMYVAEDFSDEELEAFAVLGPQLDDPYGKETRLAHLDGCPECSPLHLPPASPNDQIRVYSIVFMQNDSDIEAMINEIYPKDEREEDNDYELSLSDLDDEQIINHLMQWESGNIEEHSSAIHSRENLDGKFLGYRVDKSKENEGYLFSRNDDLGYVGLSYFKVITGDEE
jgi:hypothetical protein